MATTNYIISVRANMPTDVEAWSPDSDGGKLVIIDDTQTYRKRNTLQNVIRLDKSLEKFKDAVKKLCGVNVMPVPSKINGNDFTAVTLVSRGVVDIDFSEIEQKPTNELEFSMNFGFQIWPLRNLNGHKWRCFVDFKGHDEENAKKLFGTSTKTGMSGLESSENHLVKLVNVQAKEATEMPTLVSNLPETLLSIWPNAKGEGKVPAISQGTFTVFFKDEGVYNEYEDHLLHYRFSMDDFTSFVCLEKFNSSARFKIVKKNMFIPKSVFGNVLPVIIRLLETTPTEGGQYEASILMANVALGYGRLYEEDVGEISSRLTTYKQTYANEEYPESEDNEGGDY